MKRIVLILGIALLSLNQLRAQSNHPEVLNAYIEEAMESNLMLQQHEMDVQVAIQQLKQSRGLFFPDVSLNSDYTIASGGRTLNFPIGDLLNPVYSSLNQLNGNNAFPTDLQNVNEQFLPDNFHDTRLTIAQPLFNTDIYFGYRAQKALVSVQEAKLDTYRNELAKELKIAYYQYLQSEYLMDILNENEILVQELVRLNERLVENGISTIDAVYRARFELSSIESEQAIAIQQNQTAQSYFNFLLNRPLDSAINYDENESIPLEADSGLNEYIGQALLSRPELDQLQSGINAQNELISLASASRLPKASVGILAGYQGQDYRFTSDEDYRLVQFNISVPIFSGFRKNADIQQAKINSKIAETRLNEVEEQIKLQVIQSKAALEASFKTYYSSRAQLASAERFFEIKKRQYEEGQLLLVDYLDAQTQYINSLQQLNITRNQVWVQQAQFEQVLSL
ncbi:MAG: TolC family protein [Balneolaceae bacterium]